MTKFLFQLALLVLVLECVLNAPDSAIYRKISPIEFDAFDLEDTKEINRLRRKDNLPQLRYNVDLIDFAQKEAERLANLSRFDPIRFNETNFKTLFAYVIKYTGQLIVDPSKIKKKLLVILFNLLI